MPEFLTNPDNDALVMWGGGLRWFYHDDGAAVHAYSKAVGGWCWAIGEPIPIDGMQAQIMGQLAKAFDPHAVFASPLALRQEALMQTQLPAEFIATDRGRRPMRFCAAVCTAGFATQPAQPISFGDELDGPRGRIYLIKELFEGEESPERATQHLDRCLTCRACETTCPSGVAYGELADIARMQIGLATTGL